MEKQLIQYDYLDLEINKHFKSIYVDYYPCFGWELMDVMTSEKKLKNVHLSFRRKHEMNRKADLIRNQQKFDSYIRETRNLWNHDVFSLLSSAKAGKRKTGTITYRRTICNIVSGCIHSESNFGFLMKKDTIPKLIGIIMQTDYHQKTLLMSSCTVLMNGLIGIGKLLLGIYYFSDWLIANAIYYLALAVAKGQVIKRYQKFLNTDIACDTSEREGILFKKSGGFQCMIGISYFCVSLHTLLTGDTVSYPDYLKYVVVLISLCKVGFAVYGIYMVRKLKNQVTSVLKLIDFTDAVVSIVVARGILQISKKAVFAVESTGIFGMICSVLFFAIGLKMLFKNISGAGRERGNR